MIRRSATGQRRWTDRNFVFNSYRDAELGYAVTGHVAQGRTVTAGLAVITGAEDRPHALVALTRGTTTNLAHVFTRPPKRADPVPGPRPAPELARYDSKRAERAGVPAPPISSVPPGQALAVLAAVLDRAGQLLSATQDRHRALANADHLAVLHAIWTAETTPAPEQRYQDLLSASLPPGHHRPLGHQARWLWRTLCVAEVAGLDPPSPWPPRSPNETWPDPATWPPSSTPASATASAPPLDRLGWQRRASSIGAWRELSGYDHPADPIGPEPVAAAPDLRAAWHEALAALGPSEGPDVRGMPDGLLLHLPDSYPLETA